MLRVNLNRPAKFDSVSFTRSDLLKIGAKAIDTIIRRCDRGRNVNDRPAKPLSAKYRAKKEAQGQPGIRNLSNSGSMLGSLTIVEADQSKVVLGFTRRSELVKAEKNDQRDPWFGLSKNDEAVVGQFAGRLLQNKVQH